jgi:MEDS: MEthanogen/methylotroph, DcmR Sensory domain
MNSADSYFDKDNNTYRIVNADPATILKHIRDSDYRDHNLVVYPCLPQFEEFYSECCKDSILERKEIFVVATHYQHIYAVRKKMYLAGIDAARYENDGTLVILDSETAYQPTSEQTSTYNIIILTTMLMKQVREHDKKGITLLSDLGTFILNNRIADLISYEQSVPATINANIRPFCCYHKDDFNLLQEEQRKRILGYHSNNLIISYQE